MADYNSIYTGEEIDRRLTDVDNRIALPSPAYAGLFPRGNAQGQVDWVPHGQPTDAQTAAAVSAWLAAHPEATTTVQDGSLTKQKFAPGLVGGANGVAGLDSSGKVPDAQLPLPWTAAKTYAAGAYCEHNGYLWHNTSGAASTGVEPGTNYSVWNVTYSNPNLLDNPWFVNPVNQRGWTTGPTSGTEYTIDRWRTSNANTDVTVLSTGIRISATTSATTPYLLQRIPTDLRNALLGKPCTLSVVRSGETVLSATSTLPSDAPTSTTIYCNIPNVAQMIFIGGILYCRLLGAAGGSTTLSRSKLELGSVSTLANDAPPNYAEELAKCQWYFQRFKTQSLRPTDKDDFRPVMRIDPALSTITIDGVTYYTASADL